MIEKELRKLSRADLLEMMLSLSKENEQLRKENAQLQKQLNDRTVAIEKSGSLAEAVLQLNGLFEAAQASCEQYVYNIQQRNDHIEEICRQKEQETRARCDEMIEQAKMQAQEYLRQAEQKVIDKDSSYQWLAALMDESDTQE